MSKDCSRCDMPNADDARFCRACGAAFDAAPASEPDALPAEAPCRACGHLNRPGARFCTRCGTDQTPPAAVPVPPLAAVIAPPPVGAEADAPPSPAVAAARRPLGIWIGLAAVVVALAGGAAWWIGVSQTPARPTTVVAPAASVAPSHAPPSQQDAASSAASSLWEPIDDEATETVQEAPARASMPAPAPAPPRPITPRPGAHLPPTPAPPAPRSVLAHCANRNPILQAICEARECAHAEHAGELVCQRIKAADERRRQQEGG